MTTAFFFAAEEFLEGEGGKGAFLGGFFASRRGSAVLKKAKCAEGKDADFSFPRTLIFCFMKKRKTVDSVVMRFFVCFSRENFKVKSR